MGLFPQAFIEDLRMQADIVQVVQDHVALKQAGSSFRGLCPFHAEKTPSFHVHRDRGFFHCFGCGAGGDVFKFLELHEKIGFPEAVRLLAARFGVAVPEPVAGRRDEHADAERETLLKAHEAAAAYFREALAGPAGARARRHLAERGISGDTAARLGLGFAPAGREGLKTRLLAAGFTPEALLRSGLVLERDRRLVDRFRSRLMIPICRDGGSVIAFGGRALEPAQQPKYLNSPETAIYTKGRTLYGLHLTKGDLKRLGYAVLVEGYFDFAQALQGGVAPLVASCGTALTAPQAQLLRRYVDKVILSFDPDAAGQGAAARSSEVLVSEGFQVNVAVLPAGEDPDTFVRRHGAAGYVEKLRSSRPYLEYLIDRAAAEHDLGKDEGRRAFLTQMLGVAARIPDAAARDRFADRLAHAARITEDVVRAEIRKAAVARRTTLTSRELPVFGEMRPAERGLLRALAHQPDAAVAALAELDEDDLLGLAAAAVLQAARSLAGWPAERIRATLLERLTAEEGALVTAAAAQPGVEAPPGECVRALKRLRYQRERAALQRQIDSLQDSGTAPTDEQIASLWARKRDLLHRIEALGA